MSWQTYGFGRALLEARSLGRTFPLLERAAADAKPAARPRVEWQKEDGTVEFNLTQIVRSPMGYTVASDPAAREKMEERNRTKRLIEHLQAIEDTLWHGHRGEEKRGPHGTPVQFCGGVHELLGREPIADDVIRLRLLCDLTWIDRSAEVGAYVTPSEWLTEFTLEARASVPVAV